MKSAYKKFYTEGGQTPANAVALARADYLVQTPQPPITFLHQLAQAEDQLRDPVRAAAPQLLSALKALLNPAIESSPALWHSAKRDARAIIAQATQEA